MALRPSLRMGINVPFTMYIDEENYSRPTKKCCKKWSIITGKGKVGYGRIGGTYFLWVNIQWAVARIVRQNVSRCKRQTSMFRG